ncbi:hypothetical protein CEXT_549161 [Caerostris extrusa]|uniref:Uncharacterized protein n=1 Tax=Caerostris extrusa TaxID=172846 RepID=A0AAV4Y1H1_CAEEX|nr:hypothetical protein CEXT_549161 [Caerostris extrusa]
MKQVYFLHLNKGKCELIEKELPTPPCILQEISSKRFSNGIHKYKDLARMFYESTSTSNDPEGQIRDSFPSFTRIRSKKDIASDFVFRLVFRIAPTFTEMDKRYFLR